MRWETERSFDGKLCQEYSCQKLSKSDNICFQVTVENAGDVFWDTAYSSYQYDVVTIMSPSHDSLFKMYFYASVAKHNKL